MTRAAARRRARRSTDVTVSRVRRGGLWVRVSSIGRTGDRPFVLVPGIGVSSNYFERLAPYLNEYGPVHALDLPGFGGVPHGGETLTIPRFADLVGAVLDDLGLEDPVLVGHSMGSQVVTDLAARRPGLSTLVLIGPVVNAAERTVGRQAWRFLGCALREPGRVKALALSAYLVCGPRWFWRVLPEMMSYRLEDRLPAVRASTLVIRGECDGNSPRDWVDRVADTLPRARAWEIPGAAHSVMYAHATEVARLCVAHARVPAPERGDVDVRRLLRPEDADGDGRPDGVPPTDLAHRWTAVRGRLTELVGVIRGDDRLIERGRTLHAEAVDSTHAHLRVDLHPQDDPDRPAE